MNISVNSITTEGRDGTVQMEIILRQDEKMWAAAVPLTAGHIVRALDVSEALMLLAQKLVQP